MTKVIPFVSFSPVALGEFIVKSTKLRQTKEKSSGISSPPPQNQDFPPQVQENST
jgi:hypothetical protein